MKLKTPNRFRGVALCVIPILAIAATAMAVGTSNWTQTSEADWKTGEFDNVVATNLGDLKLSRAVKTVLEQDDQVGAVDSLAEGADGTIYAGTGPKGVLLSIKGDKVSKLATLEDATDILSLSIDHEGKLLIGTGGAVGRVLRLDPKGDEKPTEIFKAEGVHYVWQVRQTPDGNIYAATGPTGKLYEIKPDGSFTVLLETEENNLTALVSDGKEMLYVGSDPSGLIYRVNRKSRESFVMFDSNESEISALALDAKGNLYASTAEPKPEPPGQGEQPGAEQGGRPEGGAAGVPITSEPPKQPAPPKMPDPNPGRPAPIPKEPKGEKAGESRSAIPRTLRPLGLGLLLSGELDGPDSPPDQPAPHRPPIGGRPTSQPAMGQPAQPQPQPQQGPPRPEGNAVYKIDPEGFVTEVFRQPVMVLSMVESHGTLLIATGGDGQIYQVNTTAGETVALAKVDAKDVLSMLPTHDGRVFLGLANAGGIATMSPGFAVKGTYTSTVFDATQISRFGKIHLHGTLAEGTTLKVSTRSGNLRDPASKGWSEWSEEATAAEFMQVKSPSARFLQYRISFGGSDDGKQTPVVEDINIAYQMPNLAPVIRTVKIAASAANAQAEAAAAGGPQAQAAEGESAPRIPSQRRQTISWEAADPNNDPLQYTLYFRRGAEGPWILLKEKITEATYEWDTRTVADGRYEIKVVASDAAANVVGKGLTASRVSDPVLVDNTPPAIGDVKTEQEGGNVKISFRVTDETGVMAAGDYSVDSGRDWQAILPSDNIWDSPEETASFSIAGLAPGRHQVTIRATDASGNQAFESLIINVQGPAASR